MATRDALVAQIRGTIVTLQTELQETREELDIHRAEIRQIKSKPVQVDAETAKALRTKVTSLTEKLANCHQQMRDQNKAVEDQNQQVMTQTKHYCEIKEKNKQANAVINSLKKQLKQAQQAQKSKGEQKVKATRARLDQYVKALDTANASIITQNKHILGQNKVVGDLRKQVKDAQNPNWERAATELSLATERARTAEAQALVYKEQLLTLLNKRARHLLDVTDAEPERARKRRRACTEEEEEEE